MVFSKVFVVKFQVEAKHKIKSTMDIGKQREVTFKKTSWTIYSHVLLVKCVGSVSIMRKMPQN
jgi:hypothetical protein